MSDYVFVTGGAGYIGSHACKALRNAGYTPVTLDNLSTGWQDAVKFGRSSGAIFLIAHGWMRCLRNTTRFP